MGYFSQKFGIKSFKEAEADGKDLTGGEAQPPEYTEPEVTDNQTTEQQPTDDTQTQNTDEGNQQDPQPENTDNPAEETPDYTELGDDGGDSPDPNGDDPNPDEGTQDNTVDKNPVDDLKTQEEEILGLSPEQLNVKHSELKSLYLKLYDTTNTVIDRIGNISVNSENASVINFISKNLADMRAMIIDYLDKVYSGKSYIENSITYNRFVSVLHGINKMLEELAKNND